LQWVGMMFVLGGHLWPVHITLMGPDMLDGLEPWDAGVWVRSWVRGMAAGHGWMAAVDVGWQVGSGCGTRYQLPNTLAALLYEYHARLSYQ